ncbi:MAG: hypothetical protein WCA42_10390 [Desulfobacterales bacterium]
MAFSSGLAKVRTPDRRRSRVQRPCIPQACSRPFPKRARDVPRAPVSCFSNNKLKYNDILFRQGEVTDFFCRFFLHPVKRYADRFMLGVANMMPVAYIGPKLIGFMFRVQDL